MTPFLKWPGGKRWFVRQFSGLLPKQFNRYLEPFLGSGRKGQFNVPPGDRRQIVRATDNFRSVSELLAGAEIRHSDF